MGQYYLVVNKTKKQYLKPHAFSDGAKAIEIIMNAGVLKGLGYLLIKSDEGGGDLKENPFIGYWAGDEIVIVGDYDSSNLYDIAAETYTDISSSVIQALLGERDGEFIYPPDTIKEMKGNMKETPPIPFEQLSPVELDQSNEIELF